ncbi:localization factor PodJL [Parvibaculum indicum]|uniref:peptidoglycan-binding protein n=1 Tax=Parvibaculum indicum TaxID=562969 RepID=UPI0014238246|nr:peptidoglycan-binding protein [Parvibaculum indicum]NIJ42908.1 localization factor PodJL [Parvibaculum indicum]
MRSGVPWSVKGIEPEAREAAKQAARRSGLTLGAWLNQVIMDSGTDDVSGDDGERDGWSNQTRSGGRPERDAQVPAQAARPGDDDMDSLTDAVRNLSRRLERSEDRTAELTRRLGETIDELADRMVRAEHAPAQPQPQETKAVIDPLERKLQHLAERLERAEQDGGGTQTAEDKRAIQTLEKAVNAVVDHLDTSEKRTNDSLADIRNMLGQLSTRIDETEQANEREAEKKRAEAQEKHLSLLSQRLEQMEQSLSGVSGNLEQTQAKAVQAALKAFEDKAQADSQRDTISSLQKSLTRLSERLEQTEQKSQDALDTVHKGMNGIARQIDDLSKPREPEMPRELADQLDMLARRLEESEHRTDETTRNVEDTLAQIADRLSQTDHQSREALESVQSVLARTTERLARLEKTAKQRAARPASPQINAGMGPHGSFSPNFPTAAALNAPGMGGAQFDLPSIGTPAGGEGFMVPSAIPAEPVAQARAPVLREEPAAPPMDEAPRLVEPAREMPVQEPPKAKDIPDYETPEPEEDEDDGVIPPDPPPPPPLREAGAQAAQDFLAQARRAAQAASQGSHSGYDSPAYADSSARFDANDAEKKRSRLVMAATVGFIALAIVAGAFLFMRQSPTPGDTAPTSNTGAATSPAPVDPEAVPEDAGADAAPEAPASATPDNGAPENGATESGTASAPADGATAETSVDVATVPVTPADDVPPAPSAPRQVTLNDAAQAGNAAAEYTLGDAYARGEGVAQSDTQAVTWIRKAAGQGLTIAQYRLATFYEKGRGVGQDNARALQLYEQAANKGNVKAMHNLAVMYAEGRGTSQNFTKAAEWFAKAADYGLGDSQYNLAVLNERGLGVEEDLATAYQWFAIAAAAGDKGAAKKRDALAERMEPGDLADARIATNAWQAKTADPVANGDLSSLKSWNSAAAGPADPDIAQAQSLLNALGYDAGPADGMMGPRTRDAIAAFQKANGFAPSGKVTPELLIELEG